MSFTMQAHKELVGRQIRKARKAKGLSHDALGAVVGTSRQHLIKLEKGQHLPTDAMLTRIAEATDRELEFFTSESDDEEESDPVSDLLHAIRRVVRREVRAAQA